MAAALRSLLTALAVLAACPSVTAKDDAVARSFALRVGKAHTVSDGILEPAVVVVRDGKIAALGSDVAIPDGVDVYDLPGHVVIPGLIDAETSLASSTRDTLRSVAPEVRAVDGWDFFRELDDVVRGGVTTIYVSPGPRTGSAARLVSGRGTVLKTAGRDHARWQRVVASAVGVQVTLGELSRRQPSIYEPPVGASADNPFEVLERPLPQSRAGEFLALRRLFDVGRAYHDGIVAFRDKSADAPAPDPIAAALWRLFTGEDHLRVRANKARDIYHVLELAREYGLRVVIEGGAEAEKLTSWLTAMDVPVIFPGAFRPGRLEPGDLASPALEGRVDERSVVRMARAGVDVILNSPTDSHVKDLLLEAASAVRFGMSPDEALRAITLRPAEVLGVADRVGSLAVGKDADFIVLGADPFSERAAPQAVVIEGAVVYQSAPEIAAGSTVIRCGRIVTGDGVETRGGMIVVKDGKIAWVGPGAILSRLADDVEVIDASACTVIPGLIDAGGTAGLRAEALAPGFGARGGESGAAAGATLRLVESIDPRDPSLLDLLR